MNRNQILTIVAKQRQILARDFGVKSLALVGSAGRDEVTPVSDVDFLVEFDSRPVATISCFPSRALPGDHPGSSQGRSGLA